MLPPTATGTSPTTPPAAPRSRTCSTCSPPRPRDTSQDLAETISDGGAGQLKQTLIDALNERLRPLRRRRAEFVEDRDYLNDVLDAGNQRARQLAHDTLTQVHEVLGMSYSNR